MYGEVGVASYGDGPYHLRGAVDVTPNSTGTQIHQGKEKAPQLSTGGARTGGRGFRVELYQTLVWVCACGAYYT